MEKKAGNRDTKWEFALKKEANGCQSGASQPSDQCQIDNVIGDIGKYQMMIFIFKILIGVVSPFNNLGVTFFAPTDFISYWCADAAANSSILAQNNSSGNLHPTQAKPIILTSGPLMNYNRSQSLSDRLMLAEKVVNTVDYSELLNTFLFSEKRQAKHAMGLDFDTPRGLRKECTYKSPLDNQYHKCTSFKYDTGIWISTVIDEWGLVCDKAWYVSMSQSLYMSGFIISYLVFGYFSDRYGRWRSLLFGGMIEIGCGFGCAFASSVTMFMIFRFMLGIGNAGRTTSSYLIMIEWFGPKWRVHISTLGSLGWIFGYCAMPWLSAYFLHFRHMQIFVCFYEIIFMVLLLFLPESPRWLLTHKRFDKAYEVLLMASKFNGLIKKEEEERDTTTCCDNGNIINGNNANNINNSDSNNKIEVNDSVFASQQDLPKLVGQLDAPSKKIGNKKSANIFVSKKIIDEAALKSNPDQRTQIEPYTHREFNSKFQQLISTIDAKEFTQNEDKLSFIDLFKWKNLRNWAFILFFVWAVNSFIYYGIVLRVGDFGGKNLFVTFTIAGLTELPSIAFTIICMNYLPRRTSNLFMFGTVGLLCALQAPFRYYDSMWLQQITMMLAKLFNSCSFTVILYQTMELFPTSIRQASYSACSLSGRIGSIFAPFVKELAQMTNEFVPPIIYAVLSLMEFFLIKRLPETKGSDLPDTLLEAEKFKGTDSKTGQKSSGKTAAITIATP